MPELIHIQKVTFGPRDLRATLSFAQNGPVMTNANPQAAERVKWLVPEIMRHACTGDQGKTFGVSVSRTEIAHLAEHVALELMALTNLSTPITSGRTRRIADHLYEVQIAAPDDVLAASALSSAVFIINWAFQARDSKNAPNIGAIVAGLRDVVASTDSLEKEIQAEKEAAAAAEAAAEAVRIVEDAEAVETASADGATSITEATEIASTAELAEDASAAAGAEGASTAEAAEGAESAESSTNKKTKGKQEKEGQAQASQQTSAPEAPTVRVQKRKVQETLSSPFEVLHTESRIDVQSLDVPSERPITEKPFGSAPLRKVGEALEHKAETVDVGASVEATDAGASTSIPTTAASDKMGETEAKVSEKEPGKTAKKEIRLGTTVGFMSPQSPQSDEEFQA